MILNMLSGNVRMNLEKGVRGNIRSEISSLNFCLLYFRIVMFFCRPDRKVLNIT